MRLGSSATLQVDGNSRVDGIAVTSVATLALNGTLTCHTASFGSDATFVVMLPNSGLVCDNALSLGGVLVLNMLGALHPGDTFVFANYDARVGTFKQVEVSTGVRKRAADDWHVEYDDIKGVMRATYNGEPMEARTTAAPSPTSVGEAPTTMQATTQMSAMAGRTSTMTAATTPLGALASSTTRTHSSRFTDQVVASSFLGNFDNPAFLGVTIALGKSCCKQFFFKSAFCCRCCVCYLDGRCCGFGDGVSQEESGSCQRRIHVCWPTIFTGQDSQLVLCVQNGTASTAKLCVGQRRRAQLR